MYWFMGKVAAKVTTVDDESLRWRWGDEIVMPLKFGVVFCSGVELSTRVSRFGRVG